MCCGLWTKWWNGVVPSHEDDLRGFAKIHNSWLGYVSLLIQGFMALSAWTMILGYWQNSSTLALLVFLCVLFPVYVMFLYLNRRWYSVTWTAKCYWGLNSETCILTRSNTQSFNAVITRDAKYHNDQEHLSVVTGLYFIIGLFFIVFLWMNGTPNPSPDFNIPPVVYSANANYLYDSIRIFHACIIGVSALVWVTIVNTKMGFIITWLEIYNRDIMNGGSLTNQQQQQQTEYSIEEAANTSEFNSKRHPTINSNTVAIHKLI